MNRPDAPDIVVPVKESPANPHLRYALRSWAAHVPHRRVWVVGYRPPWAMNVGYIPTQQHGRSKFANTVTAILAACDHPEVSPSFTYMNDDFFVMRPVERIPILHRGPVLATEAVYERRGATQYLHGLRQTRKLLARLGFANPFSYELHTPLPVQKAGMLEALHAGRHISALQFRTMYGVMSQIGGTQIRDVKIHTRGAAFPRDNTYLSTSPVSFAHGQVGAFAREAFPEPGPYERGV